MYKKGNRDQMYIEDFVLPFGGKLKAENRWVKLSKIMPWELIEDIYVESLNETEGAPAISARIAFGAIYIKENERYTDASTPLNISENPYMQYFLGLKEFTEEPLFDDSMMTHFRKRFPAEKIEIINKAMFVTDKNDDDQTPPNDGKLVLDATCAPADIRYPSDLSLLNEARENTEQMINELYHKCNKKGRKTKYSRKKARKGYLSIAKQKQPKSSKVRKEKSKQLKYLKSNIDLIGEILSRNLNSLPERRYERLTTICELYRQQLYMLKNNVRKCDNRIISLRQPHIRTMVRGKAGKKYEFGQKLAFSVVNGYTFIENQSYENFNEGITLIESAERYKSLYGAYPKAILADQIYRNRANLAFCKEHNIRLSGRPLGRPKKDSYNFDKKQAQKDNSDRNIVESRNGIAKRRFGLNLIMSYLPDTGMTEAALQVLCMNISLYLRFLCSFFKIPFLDVCILFSP